MRTAILFPGQGSQTSSMRDRAAALRPDLVTLAGDECFARADEDTRFAQPAILVAGLAARGELPPADAVAGHSLGELTALAAAGSIGEEDAVQLAALRGRLMSACDEGTMLAALGGDADVVAAIATEHDVVVANDNAPGQLVLSGSVAGIEAAKAALRDVEVRVLELNVRGAFHSPLMAPAVPEWTAALAATEVRPPRIPVYSCVTAAPIDDVRGRLAEALTAPVRWRETLLALQAAGVEDFVDAGPGRVLAGTVKRTLRTAAHA